MNITTVFEVNAVHKFDAATGERLDAALIELRPVFVAKEDEELVPAEVEPGAGPDGQDKIIFPAVRGIPGGNACVENALLFSDDGPSGSISLYVENAAGADFFELGRRLLVTFSEYVDPAESE